MTREHTDIMSEVPTSLKDPSILILRADFNVAHAAVDRSVAEVDKHIQNIEQAKNDATVPKQMLHDYSTRLDAALTKGDTLVGTLETIHDQLINKLDLLSMTYEDQPALKDPVDAQRSKVRSVFSPYKGAFTEKRRMNRHLLSCLFTETPSPNPVPAPSTTIMPQRRDYGYLRPGVLSSECTRRELVKFSEACQIWLEKSLSAEDRADTRLVWASIRSVLDEEWTEVLNRNNIANKQFDEIYKIMDRIYLEKNPLIVQRLNARRIHKQKEETVSDCLRRIYDAYQSAELKDCPLETLSLLHLVTELPSDALSDKIKTYLVEKMRIQPNISSLEEVTTYILSIEADDVAKRSTQSQATNRVNNVSEIEDKEACKEEGQIQM